MCGNWFRTISNPCRFISARLIATGDPTGCRLPAWSTNLEKLGREHNRVGRLELGERRLDVIEFYWLCKACGANPEKTATELMRRMAAIESETGA